VEHPSEEARASAQVGGSESPPREVVAAYWPRALAAADAARARAQAGFTVASAIATGLVAAGIFTNAAERAHAARDIGAAALALWLGAMLLFLRAIAEPAIDSTPTAGARAAADLAAHLLSPTSIRNGAGWNGVSALLQLPRP
jgi:hypothetical protein